VGLPCDYALGIDVSPTWQIELNPDWQPQINPLRQFDGNAALAEVDRASHDLLVTAVPDYCIAVQRMPRITAPFAQHHVHGRAQAFAHPLAGKRLLDDIICP